MTQGQLAERLHAEVLELGGRPAHQHLGAAGRRVRRDDVVAEVAHQVRRVDGIDGRLRHDGDDGAVGAAVDVDHLRDGRCRRPGPSPGVFSACRGHLAHRLFEKRGDGVGGGHALVLGEGIRELLDGRQVVLAERPGALVGRQDLDRGQQARAELFGEDDLGLARGRVGDRRQAQVDAQLHAEHGQGEQDQEGGRGDGQPGVVEDGAGPPGPAAGLVRPASWTVAGCHRLGQRQPVHAVTQDREQGRQHRPRGEQRADRPRARLRSPSR